MELTIDRQIAEQPPQRQPSGQRTAKRGVDETPAGPSYLFTGIANSGPLLAAVSGQRCITDL